MICIHNSICTDSRRSLDAKGYDRLQFVEENMTVAGKYLDCIVLETESIVDAEDSSYDSDCEAEDLLGSANIHSQLKLQVSSSGHSDVSRTTSDTLAAEFAEYVTVQGNPLVHSPGYIARLEFALKLGYTERLVQAALEKLGPDPEQNELLAELIKLGASYSPKSIDTPEEEPDKVADTDLMSNENSGYFGSLRSIVIDGSNVAMSHGNKEIFSCRGIKICVDWFKARGHKEITVFVPKWRKETSRIDNPIADQEILGELEKDRLLVFTPSRLIGGKRMVCYDDRYILKLAVEIEGIVVSNDNYRDLAQESAEFRKVIEERILMYTFVNDRFMPPDDPLGRSGPTLDNFLKILPKRSDLLLPCPYAKKCTYGNKCKFAHPERGPHPQKSVTEKLVEHVQKQLQIRGSNPSVSLSSNISTNAFQHQPLAKTKSTVATGIQPLPLVTNCRSTENVTLDQPMNSTIHGLQMPPTISSQGYRSSCRLTGRLNNPEAEPPNMHKKLQRQLSLNPVYDPRLQQLRQYQQTSQTSSLSQQTPIASSTIQHKTLNKHSSNESTYRAGINWDRSEGGQCHQHVTRIASAPDSHQTLLSNNSNLAAPSGLTLRLGTSDSQLNTPITSLYSDMSKDMFRDFLDARTRIHYHLANIFPEEHVRNAMLIRPFETDPIEMCVAILKMYPQ